MTRTGHQSLSPTSGGDSPTRTGCQAQAGDFCPRPEEPAAKKPGRFCFLGCRDKLALGTQTPSGEGARAMCTPHGGVPGGQAQQGCTHGVPTSVILPALIQGRQPRFLVPFHHLERWHQGVCRTAD